VQKKIQQETAFSTKAQKEVIGQIFSLSLVREMAFCGRLKLTT
jgi:hypothetical protein